MTIPETVTLLVCPVCGRTDRAAPMSAKAGRHGSHGKRCPGEPVRITYDKRDEAVFADLDTPRSSPEER